MFNRTVPKSRSLTSNSILVTGKIGAGKSIVTQIFRTLGWPVFSADKEARHIMVTDLDVKNKIIHILGKDAYLPDGELNKPFIAEQIFGNDDKKTKMNAIVHPEVGKYFLKWKGKHKHPFVVREAALPYTEYTSLKPDITILVDADTAIRKKRVISRDKKQPEQFDKINESQPKEDIYSKYADFIIYNNPRDKVLGQFLITINTIKRRSLG